jgi:hypothetical protein
MNSRETGEKAREDMHHNIQGFKKQTNIQMVTAFHAVSNST